VLRRILSSAVISDPKRETESPKDREKLLQRCSLLSTNELIEWAEASMGQIGRSLSNYRHSADPESADEAVLNASGLVTILEEIRNRGVK
jgi:hypothetical protein